VGLSDWVANIGFVAFGLALILWATPLSVRYVAWITRFRWPWRPVMSNDWLARNTPVVLRTLGLLFILRSVFEIARFGRR
jgi:hypothetical protein